MDVPYAWLLDRQFELEILEATVLSKLEAVDFRRSGPSIVRSQLRDNTKTFEIFKAPLRYNTRTFHAFNLVLPTNLL